MLKYWANVAQQRGKNYRCTALGQTQATNLKAVMLDVRINVLMFKC